MSGFPASAWLLAAAAVLPGLGIAVWNAWRMRRSH